MFSNFFNDKRHFLGKLGIAGQGVHFYAFGHDDRDALWEADVSLARVRVLGGWSKDGAMRSVRMISPYH